MALSFGLHGLLLLPLLLAGASGNALTEEPAILVELALAAPTAAADPVASEAEPPPVPIEIPAPDEPPPIDIVELKPVEPPKPPTQPPTPPKLKVTRPAARPPTAAMPDVGTEIATQQAVSASSPASLIVWEGKPRFRTPPRPAAYPPRALELGQQGEALVRVRLDTDGSAAEILLWRGSGFELLDRAALAAVRGWQFLPAVRDGHAVAAWVEIPVRFHFR